MDRTCDGADSADDSGSSQPYPSTLPGIPKAIFWPYVVSHYSFCFVFPFLGGEGGVCLFSFRLSLFVIKTVLLVELQGWRSLRLAKFVVPHSCREVRDSCFNVCKDQWRRILLSHILRRSSLLGSSCITGRNRYFFWMASNSGISICAKMNEFGRFENTACIGFLHLLLKDQCH